VKRVVDGFHALTMRRRLAAHLRGMVRICGFLCRYRAAGAAPVRADRAAGLPCIANCLASDIDFAITGATKSLRVRNEPKIRLQP
jgi:hypothetical protein